MKLRVAFMALLGSLGTADSAAAGRDVPVGFRAQGNATTVVSDGLRWIALEHADGTVTLIDTRTGARRTVEPPARCAERYAPGPSASLRAAGPDALAFHCDSAQAVYPGYRHVGEPLIYVISSGEFIRPAGVAEAWFWRARDSTVSFNLTDVGHHWLRASSSGHHWQADTLWSIVTGTTKETDDGGPRAVPDVNSASGFTRMCRPLERAEVPFSRYDTRPEYASYGYERPWALTYRDGLVIDRCGTGRSRRIAAPRNFSGSAQLRSGVVSWAAPGARAMVHRLRSGRTSTYGFPSSGAVTIAHTRTHLAVRTQPQGVVYLRRLPK